jgi:hypothetical protein
MLGAVGSILMPSARLVNQALRDPGGTRSPRLAENGTQKRLATEARPMFRPFRDLFPEVAERESRTVRLESEGPDGSLLEGTYLFFELYCTDPECDCERVLLSVIEKRRGVVATISYGFGGASSSTDDDPREIFLDPINPQSAFSEEILSLFKEVVLDEVYDQRLRRHYRMVKSLTPAESGHAAIVLRPNWERSTDRQEKSARQRRKQQKAARRANRQ